MKRFIWLLGLTLVVYMCFTEVQAESGSSDSDSDTNENANENYGKKIPTNNIPRPYAVPPYGYPYYNNPAYMPYSPSVPYSGYNHPATPYYHSHPLPTEQGYNFYPYIVYYNQPPPPQRIDVPQTSRAHAPESQYFSSTPDDTSTNIHSLKANKEYSGTSTD